MPTTAAKSPWTDAVARMVELTQEGKMKWEAAPSGRSDDRTSAFTTRFANKRLKLYEIWMPNELSGGGLGLGDLVMPSLENPRGRSKIVLEIVDETGMTLWRFPRAEALPDLFATVQYQVSEAGDFLNYILQESDTVKK